MPAATVNLFIEQGSTFRQTFLYKDDLDVPVDLTGYTARMQARATKVAASILIDATTVNGKIIITPLEGKIVVVLTATETAALTFTTALYDLEIVSAGSEVTRLIQGAITVDPEVTRPTP